jgi:adenosylhomocysteine nucleosidase
MAMPIEAGPLKARLKDVRTIRAGRLAVVEGLLAGRLVALVVTGPGEAAARRGLDLLFAGHRPRWVLSAGFAGALDPALPRYALVTPSEVGDVAGPWLATGVDRQSSGPYRTGRLLTIDRIARTAADKAALRAAHGADLVDMETAALARACADRSTRFVPLRIVSDVATEDLPPEILTLTGPTGGFRLGAAFGAIWRRPSSVKDLLLLREYANEAARRLGATIEQVVASLS